MRPVVLYLQEGQRQAFGVFLRFPVWKSSPDADHRPACDGVNAGTAGEQVCKALPVVVQSFQVF